MKVTTVIGARPQFVKASMVSRALREIGGIEEKIVHTGQHYDHNMSAVFFSGVGDPPPWIVIWVSVRVCTENRLD